LFWSVSLQLVNKALLTCLDHLMISLVQDIFTVLAKNALCVQFLQDRLTPTLLYILQAPLDKVPLGLHSVSMFISHICLDMRKYRLEKIQRF